MFFFSELLGAANDWYELRHDQHGNLPLPDGWRRASSFVVRQLEVLLSMRRNGMFQNLPDLGAPIYKPSVPTGVEARADDTTHRFVDFEDLVVFDTVPKSILYVNSLLGMWKRDH